MIEKDKGAYRVATPMVVAQASSLLIAGRELLEAETEKDIVLDLAAVREADSSALAVVFALRRAAAARGLALRLAHCPSSLLSLADLYGVEDSLPLAAD
ncbi:MAG: STAS domain-containing protein [Candidatus Accumulibacter sp.]|jgi:phospholipid transport system transporter-binding protein|nr:STAS domain-containing protein [Accumulibacter sp.]